MDDRDTQIEVKAGTAGVPDDTATGAQPAPTDEDIEDVTALVRQLSRGEARLLKGELLGVIKGHEQEPEEDDTPMEERELSDLITPLGQYPGFIAESDVPDKRLFFAATMRQIRRVEFRLQTMRRIMDRLVFLEVEIGRADCSECERRAGVAELEDGLQLLDELKESLASWFGHIGISRLVQFNDEKWSKLKALAEDGQYPIALTCVTDAAAEHLAAQPDAQRIIARYEQARLKTLRFNDGAGPRDSNRPPWPWGDRYGRPWPERRNNGPTGDRDSEQAASKLTSEPSLEDAGQEIKAAI